MSEKLCVFCKHFDWDAIGSRHGDTYDDEYGGATCKEGHYKEERPYNTNTLRELLLMAELCKAYERPKE